ncbi:unnamed protein product [Rotaria socialis]|uniref:Uncharacterized protein n=1 Tax=Rotaria socialis TaxID=392032 RepID=A0A818IM07_9BILA|nr:unnamed protein product [Rotaria socialis]
MARCLLAALRQYNCGRDLICLASILSVSNTTTLLTKLPQRFKNSDGDFMTLLSIMNEILLIKQSVAARSFNLKRVCEAKSLTHIRHIIGQALRRYTSLEKSFDISNEYRQQAQIKSDKWELIAKALLIGYSNNVFVSKKDLQDRTHHFARYSDINDTAEKSFDISNEYRQQAQIKSDKWELIAKALLVGYSNNVFVSKKDLQDRTHHFARYSDINDTAVLHLKPTLTRPISQAPVSLVVARDILYLSSIRLTAIISFLGVVKPDGINHNIERQIKLNEAEENCLKTNNGYSTAKSMFSNIIHMEFNNGLIHLNGLAGVVLTTELYLLQQSIIEYTFCLENNNPSNSTKYKNLQQNLDSVMKMPQIFNPMIWRWEAEKQVKMSINSNTATKTCEITIKGRDSQIQKVKEEFDSFLNWLQDCAVFRHPNSGENKELLF